MSNDQLLTDSLRGVAEEQAGAGASPAVRARLLGELRAIRETHRRAEARRNVWMFAAAAALALAAGTTAWESFARQTAAAPAQAATALASREIVTDFLPLAYSSVPLSGGQLIRMEVPRAALTSFGLTPPDAAEAGQAAGTVLADVIVGDDGLARAVRFVRSGP
jgi:hypothetical protein